MTGKPNLTRCRIEKKKREGAVRNRQCSLWMLGELGFISEDGGEREEEEGQLSVFWFFKVRRKDL